MRPPATLRARRQAVRWSRTLRRALRGPGTTYVGERVGQYREYWTTAAAALGADFSELTDRVWEVRRGGKRTRISHFIVQFDDTVTNTLAGDKLFGYAQARAEGVPVPRHDVFALDELDAAAAFAATLGGPCVVKPTRGSASAIGVTTHVAGRPALTRAACLASLFCDDWIVESMHFGESCRLLMLDGELLHAVRRRGVRVRGDGKAPISELLPAGLDGDGTVEATLAAAGLSRQAVPESGAEVLVSSLPDPSRDPREPRTVYDEDITATVHRDLIAAARAIAARFGARFVGVDFVTPDATRPLRESGGVFLELNTTPGIHHHDTGSGERPLPVALRVLETLLDEGVPVTTPAHGSDPARRKEIP